MELNFVRNIHFPIVVTLFIDFITISYAKLLSDVQWFCISLEIDYYSLLYDEIVFSMCYSIEVLATKSLWMKIRYQTFNWGSDATIFAHFPITNANESIKYDYYRITVIAMEMNLSPVFHSLSTRCRKW